MKCLAKRSIAPSFRRNPVLLLLLWLVILGIATSVHAVAPGKPLLLLTAEEAALPDAPVQRSEHLASNGPVIEVTNLEMHDRERPVPLHIRVRPRAGVPVAMNTLRLVCLKSKPVELTDRVQPFITSEGLALDQIVLPQGNHRFRLTVADARGRFTERDFVIKVSMPY